MTDLEEYEIWDEYPQYRKWFNKLWLSQQLGYVCGPCGYAPKTSGTYIIRPIYNLAGMGLGAFKTRISSGDRSKVPPGSFWCEFFDDAHFSATYEWKNNEWQPIVCWRGYNDKNIIMFSRWVKSYYTPKVPKLFNELKEIGIINIEFKGNNPIEVHLRASGNPDGSVGDTGYSEYIPIWEDTKVCLEKSEYTFINAPEDADGLLPIKRIGFLAK